MFVVQKSYIVFFYVKNNTFLVLTVPFLSSFFINYYSSYLCEIYVRINNNGRLQLFSNIHQNVNVISTSFLGNTDGTLISFYQSR